MCYVIIAAAGKIRAWEIEDLVLFTGSWQMAIQTANIKQVIHLNSHENAWISRKNPSFHTAIYSLPLLIAMYVQLILDRRSWKSVNLAGKFSMKCLLFSLCIHALLLQQLDGLLDGVEWFWMKKDLWENHDNMLSLSSMISKIFSLAATDTLYLPKSI